MQVLEVGGSCEVLVKFAVDLGKQVDFDQVQRLDKFIELVVNLAAFFSVGTF